jgi:hypothetical protein
VSNCAKSPGAGRIAVLAVLLLPLTVGAGWLVVDSLALAVSMPAQLNYLDGYTADDILRLARGAPLYPDPAESPYTVTVYPPVFFAAAAGAVRLGVDPIAAGRLLALLSMVAAAGCVVWFGFRRTGWVALLVGLALLLHPLQWPWSLVIRPDLAAILLSVLAVMTADAPPDRRRGVAIPIALCVAAVFTKQTALAAPAAVIIGLFARDRRAAIRFSAGFIAATAAGAITLQAITRGQFLFHTVTANTNPFSVERAASMYGRFFAASPVVAAAIAILLASALHRRRLSLPGTYAVLALITALAVGKVGSSLNYFLEPLVAVALWTAHDFPRRWFASRRPLRTVAAILGAAAVGLLSIASCVEQVRAHGVARTALPLHAELVRRVAGAPGPVVSDDATLLVGAGKPVHFRPFIMTQLAEAGRWHQQPFLDELEAGNVSLVIYRTDSEPLHESRYTREMRELFSRRYRPWFDYRIGGSFLALRPAPPADSPDPAPSDR